MALTPTEVRALFPACESYAWLNAAASSPTCTPVLDAMTAFLRDTVQHGDVHYPAWARAKDQTRTHLARFLNCAAEELAFTQSTSFGFHVIAQVLLQHGITEVLTLESEFPSTTLPLLYDGLTLRGVTPRSDGAYRVEDMEAALRPGTKAIAVSAVQFGSGFRVDLGAVAQLCRSRGLAFIINAAQALGQVPLDVRALGADFVAATSHKWLMAGYGTGILFTAKKWLESSRLPFGGWLSVEPHEQFQTWAHAERVDDATGFTAKGTKFRKAASALEPGGGSWLNLVALDAALGVHEAVGVERTLEHNQRLQLQLRGELRRRGFVPNTPDDVTSLSGICVVPVQGEPLDLVRLLLREERIATSARAGGWRISTHVFNDAADVERLVSAVDRLAVLPRPSDGSH